MAGMGTRCGRRTGSRGGAETDLAAAVQSAVEQIRSFAREGDESNRHDCVVCFRRRSRGPHHALDRKGPVAAFERSRRKHVLDRTTAARSATGEYAQPILGESRDA